MTETNAYYHHPGMDSVKRLDEMLDTSRSNVWFVEAFSDRTDDDVIPLPDGRVSVPVQLVSELNWLRGFRQGVRDGLRLAAEARERGR